MQEAAALGDDVGTSLETAVLGLDFGASSETATLCDDVATSLETAAAGRKGICRTSSVPSLPDSVSLTLGWTECKRSLSSSIRANIISATSCPSTVC